MTKKCHDKAEEGQLDNFLENLKKLFRAAGGGHKTKVPELRVTLFKLFIDKRTYLSARLPRSLFLLKAQGFYQDWLKQHPDTTDAEKLRFYKSWIKTWPKEFDLLLKFPNKSFSISKTDCIIRLEDYLKNILRCFFQKFGVIQAIIDGNQILLQRNESSKEATFAFKNTESFVKENVHVSRKCVTVSTEVDTDENIKLLPEFVFKRTGYRPPRMNVPYGINHP